MEITPSAHSFKALSTFFYVSKKICETFGTYPSCCQGETSIWQLSSRSWVSKGLDFNRARNGSEVSSERFENKGTSEEAFPFLVEIQAVFKYLDS
jgi:hypothetical protein